MTALSRRRLLLLPAAALASLVPAPAQASTWPGESMEPEQQVKFVYGITQDHEWEINEIVGRVGGLENLAAEFLKHFFGGQIRRRDRGEM